MANDGLLVAFADIGLEARVSGRIEFSFFTGENGKLSQEILKLCFGGTGKVKLVASAPGLKPTTLDIVIEK